MFSPFPFFRWIFAEAFLLAFFICSHDEEEKSMERWNKKVFPSRNGIFLFCGLHACITSPQSGVHAPEKNPEKMKVNCVM